MATCAVAVLSIPIIAFFSRSGQLFFVWFAVLGIALYMAPTWVAVSERHPHAAPICVVNVMLGWTLLGWTVALVWALMPPDRKE